MSNDELKISSPEALKRITEQIKCGLIQKIIVLTGAGISVSAGIPDFRTPGTGIYANLQKYHLPSPESMFDLEYFRQNPYPFYEFAKELHPYDAFYAPTKSHHFIANLQKAGLLLRNYTQNIDGLEKWAGLPSSFVIQAHGNFETASCYDRSCSFSLDEASMQPVKDAVKNGKPLVCPRCLSSTVKPNIVFFGEGLPDVFDAHLHEFRMADLLIVMGTSLKVKPFSALIDRVPLKTPRILINNERAGLRATEDQAARYVEMIEGNQFISSEERTSLLEKFYAAKTKGLQFDASPDARDIFIQGTCDAGASLLQDLWL